MGEKLLSILFPSLLITICTCNAPVFESIWKTSEIVIDGNTTEWNNKFQYVKDNKFAAGIANDDKFLYLSFSSWDRQTSRQIMAVGLTIWFETKSNKGDKFGIHFPLGMTKTGLSPHFMNRRIMQDQDQEQMKEIMDAACREIEILGPKKDDSRPLTSKVAESFGISAQMRMSIENLDYELKIPLHEDSLCRFAINSGTDSLIKISFESSKPDFEQMRGSKGGPPGMGGGGLGGIPQEGGLSVGTNIHHGGMGHGMGHNGSPGMSEQFKMKFTIMLAKAPLINRK